MPGSKYQSPEWRQHISEAKRGIRTVYGETHGNHKVTWDEIREMRHKYVRGVYGYKRLAKEYRISKSTVWWIVHEITWKEET